MHDKLFESALGISGPWSVRSVEFAAAGKRLTVLIDFAPGTRFAVSGQAGVHPVHDALAKAEGVSAPELLPARVSACGYARRE